MPKQKIHDGRVYSLIPLKEPSGDIAVGDDGLPHSHWYKPGYTDTDESNRLLGTMDPKNYLLNDHEPHALLAWDKRRETYAAGAPDDQGYVYIELEVTPEWLRKKLREYELQVKAAGEGNLPLIDLSIMISAGPLTWQDLNVLARAARTARDSAFGKPE